MLKNKMSHPKILYSSESERTIPNKHSEKSSPAHSPEKFKWSSSGRRKTILDGKVEMKNTRKSLYVNIDDIK